MEIAAHTLVWMLKVATLIRDHPNFLILPLAGPLASRKRRFSMQPEVQGLLIAIVKNSKVSSAENGVFR